MFAHKTKQSGCQAGLFFLISVVKLFACLRQGFVNLRLLMSASAMYLLAK
jgi:hypothetical protein